MIPLRLQLKNFLSYGSTVQTVDFSPYNLICLSGKNGHGKSALLDALTWAIWGQARKIGSNAKADHGVLRLGQVEMMVCLDFMFNNQTYRIKRDYSKKYGKPHLHVEFGLLDADDGHFISLTDKTVRKTQIKIEKTLGLDYETFINSSFLRQGQANEFSKKSSKERKEVLSAILGLHHYDATKKYILDSSKDVSQEKGHLERLKERIAEQLETLKTIPDQKKDHENKAIELKKEEVTIAEQYKILETEQESLSKKIQEHSLLSFKTTEKKEFLKTQKMQLEGVTHAWKATHKLLLALPDKEHLEKEKQKLLKEIAEQQNKFQKSLTLKEAFLYKKETFNTLKNSLEKEYTSTVQDKKITVERLKLEIQEQEKKQIIITLTLKDLKQKEDNLEETIAMLRSTISAHGLVTDFKEFQDFFEKKKALYQKWVEQGNWINNERKSLAQKQLLSQDSEQPSCPLCEQNLSQSRKRFLHKKFYDQEAFLVHRFNRLKRSIEQIKEALTKSHKELTALSEIQIHTKEQERIKKEFKVFTNESKELSKEQETKQDLLKKEEETLQLFLQETTKKLNEHPDCIALQKEINSYEKELLEVTYNSEEHKKNSTLLKDIESQLATSSTLENQKALQEERKSSVQTLCSQLKALTKECSEYEKKLKEFNSLEKDTELFKQKTAEWKIKKTEIEKQKETITHAQGHLESEEKKRQQLVQEQKKCAKTITTLETQLHEYQIMIKAFGKDGIQALLIEDAIPEIEQEANELLAKLTDNQASIHIESLRDLKSGGTRETLDINISDATGIRPYELFSGGEAFRIDFSLRIAISKLLARRAGTSLQTLIIDEGFGSQDEDGLQRIMDAIYAIQNSFEKIIIVSHLTAMKDQFPVHFIIHKDPQGSKVTVFEQG